jgi:CRISPR/Cas system-associated exonuclease Cas4 (RecB family)
METISTNGLKAKHKSFNCLGVTTVSKHATGSNNCALAHYYSYEYKQEPDPSFDSEQFNREHSMTLLNTIPKALEKLPNAKFLEPEQQFLKMKVSGRTVFGVPDLVAIEDDKIYVFDAKSGKKREEHSYQVALYALMGLANRYATKIGGVFLSYGSKNNDFKDVELIELGDEKFVNELWNPRKRDQIKSLMNLMGSGHEPEPNPSKQNCKYCPWNSRCSNRFKEQEPLELF